MNYIDMFIAVLFIWAVYKGFTRGLIMQLTILAAIALGIFAALKFSGFTANQLEGKLNMSSETLFLVSIALTFILVFIAVNLIGRLLEKVIESVDLSIINRLMGVLLSVIKMAVILGILLAYVNRLDRKLHFLPDNSREHSLFYGPLTDIVVKIFPSLDEPSDSKGFKHQV